MTAEYEELASTAALRALDKQERLVEELRARTGILLGASSIAISLLARDSGPAALLAIALIAFGVSTAASVYVLVPKRRLRFAVSGTRLHRALYPHRDDLAEVHRRLAHELDRFYVANDASIARQTTAYSVAATALVVEVVSLVAVVGGTIL